MDTDYSGKIYTKKYETEGSSTRNELLITVEGEREKERERFVRKSEGGF